MRLLSSCPWPRRVLCCVGQCQHRHIGHRANMDGEADEFPQDGRTGGADGQSTTTKARRHYQRRTSDPQTLRQRGDFQRDLKFGKRRPLPDAPWRQIKAKTYLDDAERLYGRKEQWHLVEDDVLREKLVTILQDYLRDTISAVRLDACDATKYRHLCDMAAKEYRAHVIAGAYSSPAMLRAWAQGILTPSASTAHNDSISTGQRGAPLLNAAQDELRHGPSGAAEAEHANAPHGATPEPEDAAWLEARLRRGREAVVQGTPAMSDLPNADGQAPSPSAFPFLRQRAVENERSLDPSLVDWTAKFFPHDTASTFATPPKLRQRASPTVPGDLAQDSGDAAGAADDTRDDPTEAEKQREQSEGGHSFPKRARGYARLRLQSSLRVHNDRNRATFDAEGAFFHVRRQTEESERAPKPKPVRGSDESFAENARDVVKVPWSVVSAAKRRGYSTETLRAKERLVRLSRGEDPETIP